MEPIAIINLDTLEIFTSMRQASLKYKTNCHLLRAVCEGKAQQAGSCRWAFLTDYNNNTIPVFHEQQKQYCVYKLTFPNQKIYIGQTCDLKHRWRGQGNGYKHAFLVYRAIQTFGWQNIIKEIIEENLSQEAALAKERELIDFYHSADSQYGYNGVGGTVEGKVINLENNRVFNSVTEAARYYHIYRKAIIKVCLGEWDSTHGFHFAFLIDYQNNTIPVFIAKPKGNRLKCVETGEEYQNSCQAAKILGVSSVRLRQVVNTSYTCLGYHWVTINN